MITAMVGALLLVLVAELADSAAQPRPRTGLLRSARAWPFRLGITSFFWGALLLVTGNATTAAIVCAIVLLTVALGSNAKRKILGESLCFTDFALVGEMVRHPRFYWGAISRLQRAVVIVVILTALAALVRGSTLHIIPRLLGAALMGSAVLSLELLRFRPWQAIMKMPDLDGDIRQHGLFATLPVYLRRLRDEPPLRTKPPLTHHAGAPPLLVVIQCESFTDSRGVFPGNQATELPGLEAARRRAWRHGRLSVSGFGAYTMRTEYGVLFGRSEEEIGFRRYDPFLSACDIDCADALPNRLRQRFGALSATFVHPHPLEFYRRDRLMPQVGFDRLIGAEAFKNALQIGPHVADAALGDKLISLIQQPAGPDLIYAVSIENHGPWMPNRLACLPGAMNAWLHHRRHGDQLLARLIAELDERGQSAVLCFFGDHLPSIPGEIEPAADRDTPFVILRFPEADTPASTPDRISPADLNDLLLEAMS